MKKPEKFRQAINRQLTVMAIGVLISAFALPALLTGDLSELFVVHSHKLRNIPPIVFLLLGLSLIILSLINILKLRRKGKV